MVAVTAVANTHVLEIGVVTPKAADADQVASALARSYLRVRQQYLDQRRDHLLVRLSDELRVAARPRRVRTPGPPGAVGVDHPTGYYQTRDRRRGAP